jgi:pyruvate/2-oxoglutarate/acetoin dehydrogenase E1 component
MRLSISEALRKAIHDEMARDPSVFCLGEDIGIPGGYGGAFTVTLGLEKDFRERIIDTPISEIAIFGLACGAAAMGMRPIADVQYGDFLFCAMDQVADQNLEPIFMSIPGIKIVAPSTAYDAMGLLRSAVREDDPVLIFEHKLLYGSKGMRAESGSMDASSEIPEEDYTVPIGKGIVRREGADVTVVGSLLMMHFSLRAAELLEAEGVSCEVIDPRSLWPLDLELIQASVRKTGRLVIVEESPKQGGLGAEIGMQVAETIPDCLLAPITRVAAPNTPAPFSPVMEKAYVPQPERIADTIRQLVAEY